MDKRVFDKYYFCFLSNSGDFKKKHVRFPKRAKWFDGALNEIVEQLNSLTNWEERFIFKYRPPYREYWISAGRQDKDYELLRSIAKIAFMDDIIGVRTFKLSNGILSLEKKYGQKQSSTPPTKI